MLFRSRRSLKVYQKVFGWEIDLSASPKGGAVANTSISALKALGEVFAVLSSILPILRFRMESKEMMDGRFLTENFLSVDAQPITAFDAAFSRTDFVASLR